MKSQDRKRILFEPSGTISKEVPRDPGPGSIIPPPVEPPPVVDDELIDPVDPDPYYEGIASSEILPEDEEKVEEKVEEICEEPVKEGKHAHKKEEKHSS